MMGIALLASTTKSLFITMLVVMVIICFIFAFIVFIALKPVKKPPEEVDPNNVKSMLSRRESNLLLELMQTKDNEAKRAELINKIRRVKSAQALVDELIEEEKAINLASEEDEANRKKRRSEEVAKAKEVAAKKAAANKGEGAVPSKPAAKPQQRKPAAPRPKKDSLEFKPSQDSVPKASDKASQEDKPVSETDKSVSENDSEKN